MIMILHDHVVRVFADSMMRFIEHYECNIPAEVNVAVGEGV